MKFSNIITLASLTSLFVLSACTTVIPMIAPSMESEENISADFPYEGYSIDVLNSNMFYVDHGPADAPVVVLVHGNPTSSYLWRNIIPQLAKTHRVIAPDLIGMGKSGKPDIEYSLQDHQQYFDAFIQALALEQYSLVLHDWGGALGVNHAKRNEAKISSIMMIEAVLRPMQWSEADAVGRYLFKKFRDPKDGQELLVEQNYFIEKLLPMMAGRELSEEEMTAYRAPYLDKASRKPIRRWPQEIPIGGTPTTNVTIVQANYDFLLDSNIPLHFVHAKPGLIYSEDFIAALKKDIPSAKYTNIGEGLHYLQESKPAQLSIIIEAWLNQASKS